MKKLIILAVVLAVVIIGWSKFRPVAVNPTGISVGQAQNLIRLCQAKGVYSYHNGEAGLILDQNKYQKVNGATREQLDGMKNPVCPFSQAAME